jgi:hypothetical protein
MMIGIRFNLATRYVGAQTYPPKPTTRSLSRSAFDISRNDLENRKGHMSALKEIPRGNGAFVIGWSTKPLACINDESRAALVPMNSHSIVESSLLNQRATARAGSI